jgi:hypothetical protein
VPPVPIVFSGIQRSFDTLSLFSYSANIGLRYAMERGATLSNWTAIRTDTALTLPLTVILLRYSLVRHVTATVMGVIIRN